MSDKKSTRDLWKNDDFPRLRLARITSSKSLMVGSSGRVLSRSWMNSLKPRPILAYIWQNPGGRTDLEFAASWPYIARSRAAYSS